VKNFNVQKHFWYDYLGLFNRKYFITKLTIMLRWTITFLIIAIIAAVFGFTGIAAGAATIAKILFFVFIVLFLLSLIGGRRTID
jgi:uncharacterized membrane protein YtjA (UPF0391 family)